MIEPNVGDYFVVHTKSVAGRLIQLGTWSKWNHSGIYLGNGMIVEALIQGVALSPISKYDNDPIIWSTGIDSPFTEAEAENLRNFALTFVGDPYGLWSIIATGLKCLGISLLPAIRRAENERQVICSQLVAWLWSHEGRKVSLVQHALVTPKILATRLSRNGTTPKIYADYIANFEDAVQNYTNYKQNFGDAQNYR